ncbi:MAG: MFS transporter [Chloroflexota bacterium]
MRSLRLFRTTLANRDIRLAELAWTAGVGAESAWLVSLLVYANTVGGVLGVGLISVARTLPAAIAAPLVTSAIDRWPRERVLLGMHLADATLIGLAVLTIQAGLPAGIVFGIAVVEGVVATLHRPANSALMPGLARSPDELVAGNAVTSTLEGIGVLVGPALAGVMLAAANPSAAMLLSVTGFIAGALLIGRVRPVRPPRRARGGRLVEAMAGFRALRHAPDAAKLIGLVGSQTFVRGLLAVLIVSAAVGPLGMGEGGVGFLNAAIGAGGLIGAVAAMALVGRRRLATPFSLSLAAWGLPILVLGIVLNPVSAILLLAIVGIANASLDVSAFSLIQRIVPNEVRGRVFGALEGLVALGMGLGAIAAPLLVGLLGVQGALAATGLILPVVALVSLGIVRRADAGAILPEQELSLLRGIPMFAPLPMTSLEALAGALQPRHVAAGTELIREGEIGDRYYVLSTGAAEIWSGGALVDEMHAGDGFGEIALLRDVPRTATVKVVRDAEIFQLERAAFLEAVTGSHASVAAADLVIAERTRA